VEVGGKRLGVWETLIRFTAPWNLLGFPAISLPSGFTESGLPLGLQLVGLPGHEEALLALAHRLELAGMKAAAPPNPPAHG
jgi:aspartyl-tRNA(Asn)/glutamyl-tRNA(Gln) amidotransferase subunit A